MFKCKLIVFNMYPKVIVMSDPDCDHFWLVLRVRNERNCSLRNHSRTTYKFQEYFAMWILVVLFCSAPAHVFTSTSWTFGLALWDPVTCCEVGYSLHGRSYANWSWWVGVSAQVHRGFLYVHVSSEYRDNSECLERSCTCSRDWWTHGPPRGTESGEPKDLAFALRRGCRI